MGLGSDVVKLAMVGGFKHMLYISCGREALKRDLEVLLEKRKEKVKGGGGWKGGLKLKSRMCFFYDQSFPAFAGIDVMFRLKRRVPV